ncbi:MAG TPA: hypothetical protein PKW21_02400 [Rhabdaerophilum sp.]|nr:hypothetical protein [Rhabdaerophilum sp.]
MIPQSGKAAESIQAFFFNLIRFLPTEWASAIGSYGIRKNAWSSRPETIEGARRNLRIHRPEASDAEIDAMVDEFLDGVGRVAAEFAVIQRFLDEGRVEATGLDAFKSVSAEKPMIALCVHTGNWEVFAPVCQRAGIKLNSIIAPPENGFERMVIDKVRRAFGVNPILPDLGGIREAMRVLRAGGVVSMFPDEARNGRSMGPLFGRAPHDQGNLAIAAKLARKTGAALAVGHCRRVGACRFVLTVEAPFEMPEREAPDLLADVAFLNGHIEPIIQRNIPRWYFLDDSIS